MLITACTYVTDRTTLLSDIESGDNVVISRDAETHTFNYFISLVIVSITCINSILNKELDRKCKADSVFMYLKEWKVNFGFPLHYGLKIER